jgi:hypothetical protein
MSIVLRLKVLSTLLLILLLLPVNGQPLSPVQQVTAEFAASLQKRQIEPKFADMVAFFGDRLDASTGDKTFSDKAGNCRLSWYDWMMRHPQQSIVAADEFTRAVHAAASRQDGASSKVVAIAATKLDAPLPGTPPSGRTAQGGTDLGLQALERNILQVRQEHAQALAPLTPAEHEELKAKLYLQTTGPEAHAPFFSDKTDGRRVSDLLEKMDRRSLMQAAATMSELSEQAVLRQLIQTTTRRTRGKAQVTLETPSGKIVFGGSGNNEYRLNEMADVCAVVDLGGDDVYLEGTVSTTRPVLVLIDLGGNDT